MSHPLRLAVDGRNLTKPLSGIGRLLSQTIAHLPADRVNINILLPQPLHQDFDGYFQAAHFDHNQLATVLGQPIYSANAVDVLWGPAHRLPIGIPRRIPVVLTVNDLVWRKHPETMRWRTWLGEKLFFTHAVNRADRIICVSQSTADDLAFYCPKAQDKIRIIYPGANPPVTEPQIPSQAFALFVGTLEPRKNLERLLTAYAGLSHINRDACHLVIAGGAGWGNLKIDKLIKEKGLNPFVHVIKSPDEKQLNQLYADCAFLVMPSLYEGFGLPIAEAMQYGKPCITSNISSMPEVAGNAGILVDPLSIDDITKSLATMITDDVARTSLQDEAKMSANRFSWSASAKVMLDVFYELL